MASDVARSKVKSTKQESAKKHEETTNASMKSEAVPEQTGVEAVSVGSIKEQVEALLNVYTEQATAEDQKLVKSILGLLKSAWNTLKAVFSKKKGGEGQEQLPSVSKEEALAKLTKLFETSDSLSEIANDSGLMNRIMTEMPTAERNQVLDAMYDDVADKDILKQMIEVRFGVIVYDGTSDSFAKLDKKTQDVVQRSIINESVSDGSKADTTPKDWNAPALQEVYKVYILLPQSDLDLITCLLHRKDTGVSGAALGYAKSTSGVYWVNYNKDDVQQTENYNTAKGGVQGHIDSENDKRNGFIKMDMTTAHELGHVVDGNSGWKYSNKGSAMWNASGWEETPDDPATIVDKMADNLSNGPYEGKLSDEELRIVKRAAVLYLGRDQDNYANWGDASIAMKEDVKTVMSEAGKDATESSKLANTVVKKNRNSLLYHLWRGQAANSSHYHMEDAMNGMKRPFHQGYKGQPWYTFDYGMWSDKISCYQYRCPKEEFAELYASYHTAPLMGKKKGENTPSKLLSWFVSEGLGEVIPESGSSAVQEEAEHH